MLRAYNSIKDFIYLSVVWLIDWLNNPSISRSRLETCGLMEPGPPPTDHAFSKERFDVITSVFPGTVRCLGEGDIKLSADQTWYLQIDASESQQAHLLYIEQGTYRHVLDHRLDDFPPSVSQWSTLMKESRALMSGIIAHKDELNKRHFNLLVPSLALWCWIKSREGPPHKFLSPFSYTLHLLDKDDPFTPKILLGQTL